MEKHAIIKEAVSTLVESSLKSGATQITSKVDLENGKFVIFVKDNGEGMDKITRESVKSLLGDLDRNEGLDTPLKNLAKYVDDYHLATREGAGTEITFAIK